MNEQKKTNIDDYPPCLTVTDMMEITQLSRKVIDREIHTGSILVMKIGGSYRCRKEDFIKWMNAKVREHQREISRLF